MELCIVMQNFLLLSSILLHGPGATGSPVICAILALSNIGLHSILNQPMENMCFSVKNILNLLYWPKCAAVGIEVSKN